MTEPIAYNDALADAGAAAARLGLAAAVFDQAIKVLASVTPKCACGWAEGHRGPHRRQVPSG